MFDIWPKKTVKESLEFIKNGETRKAIGMLSVAKDRLNAFVYEMENFRQLLGNVSYELEQAVDNLKKKKIQEATKKLKEIEEIDNRKIAREFSDLSGKMNNLINELS